MKVCLYCGEHLRLTERGWVHEDGSLYKQRELSPEEVDRFERRAGRPIKDHERFVDDHCAAPVDEMEFAV